jgi:hypothetical protein
VIKIASKLDKRCLRFGFDWLGISGKTPAAEMHFRFESRLLAAGVVYEKTLRLSTKLFSAE